MRNRRDRCQVWAQSVLPAVGVGVLALAIGFVLGMARPRRITFVRPEEEGLGAP